MLSSDSRLIIAGMALLATVGAYWITFQPTRPLGAIPVLVWASCLVIAIGAVMLGEEMGRRFQRTDRLSISVLQIASLLCFATIGIGTGFLADPDWWDYGLIRVYYFFAFVPGVLLIALIHLGGLLLAQIRGTS